MRGARTLERRPYWNIIVVIIVTVIGTSNNYTGRQQNVVFLINAIISFVHNKYFIILNVHKNILKLISSNSLQHPYK